MIWQQPWAGLGLLVIAAPIIIHLLGLGRSPKQRFPTLRFFDVTRLSPTRRTQLHDPWLLLLRVAIFVAAVAALAQPLYRSEPRERAFAASLARVVVLDTSASVQRTGALDSARRLASVLIDSADVGVVLETASPAIALDGAIAWLGLQAQRRELVVISDFQLGALDSASLRRVPNNMGVRLQRIAGAPLSFPMVIERRVGSRAVAAAITRADSGLARYSQVEWSSRPLTGDTDTPTSVRVLAGDAERDAVRAAREASYSVGTRFEMLPDSSAPRDSAHPIAIVTLGSPQRRALLATARAPREPWMLEAIASLQSDVLLQETARRDESIRGSATGSVTNSDPDVVRDLVTDSVADSATGFVVAYGADDRPAVWAAEADVEGRTTLALVVNLETRTLTMPALLAAARAVSMAQPDETELEPERFSDMLLANMNRAPATLLERSVVAPSSNTVEGESDGRWLWLLVLFLLGAEWLFRRRLHAQRAQAVAA